MEKVLDKVLTWLRDVLPSVAATASLVYNYMLRRLNKAEKQKEKLELKLKYEENEDEVEQSLHNKSDSDVIMDAISEGGSKGKPEGD